MRYQVKVRLKSGFIEDRDGVLVVGIKALPKKGKANQELVKKLANYYEVDESKVKIISGLSSRNKVIEIK